MLAIITVSYKQFHNRYFRVTRLLGVPVYAKQVGRFLYLEAIAGKGE